MTGPRLRPGPPLARRSTRSSVLAGFTRVMGSASRLAFEHCWWVASALTLFLILVPTSLIYRLDLLAYDVLAGDLMGSAAFARWRGATSGLTVSSSPRFGSVPSWVEVPAHQSPANRGAAMIIAIDDASLQAFGAWPWPRKRHAELIDVLEAAGARAIAYDVQFSEAAQDPRDDAALVDAVARYRNVVLPVYPVLREDLSVAETALHGPLPALRRSAAALGHAALALDEDGTSRRALLDLRVDGRSVPSMPMALWSLGRSLQDDPRTALPSRPDTPVEALGARDTLIDQPAPAHIFPVREALLPAGAQRVPQISAARVLMDPAARIDLRGRALWVGVTATGLTEPLSTPAARPEAQWSRVRWQAQVYEGLRRDELIQPLDPALAACAVLPPLVLMALIAGRQRGVTRGRWGLALVALPAVSTVALLVVAWAWLPPAAGTIGWSIGYTLWRGRHLHLQRRALERWQQRADATLHAIADAVVTVDNLGRIEYVNPVTARWLSLPARHLYGRQLDQISAFSEESRAALATLLNDALDTGSVTQAAMPLRLLSLDGTRYINATATPVHAAGPETPAGLGTSPALQGGGSVGAVIVLSDITERRQSERRLRHEATHDALTGLLNRAGLTERLQQALDDRLLSRQGVGVLFIDLDRFKRINDSLGHHHGDTVLRTIAHRLMAACEARDTVARWGGDEFVVLTPDCEGLARRAQSLVDAVSQDLRVDDMDVQCGCSIGIALAPQDGTTIESLLAKADLAMYRSKASGGRRYAFTDHESRTWTRESLGLEGRLRRSLGDGTLSLYYQPQVRLTNGDTVGLEALLRWHQPDGTVWTPPNFLTIAESSDVILPLGDWVINQAVQQVAAWRDHGIDVVPVSVNVSARQCLDLHLVELIAHCLARHRVPAHLLKIEVTETTAMADIDHVSALLQDLRALGVSVAVDDFGTGYSSLAHLRRLPVDQIKIDQSFVREIANDRYDAAVVRAMISLAHELGVPVVAEGVETEAQTSFLALHGCDIAQGYFYAQPMDALAASDYLQLQQLRGRPLRDQHRLALH